MSSVYDDEFCALYPAASMHTSVDEYESVEVSVEEDNTPF